MQLVKFHDVYPKVRPGVWAESCGASVIPETRDEAVAIGGSVGKEIYVKCQPNIVRFGMPALGPVTRKWNYLERLFADQITTKEEAHKYLQELVGETWWKFGKALLAQKHFPDSSVPDLPMLPWINSGHDVIAWVFLEEKRAAVRAVPRGEKNPWSVEVQIGLDNAEVAALSAK